MCTQSAQLWAMPVLFLFVLATWQYRCSQGLGDGRFLQTAFNSGADHPARTCTPSTRFHFAPRQSTASPNNPGLRKIGPWHDGMSQMYIQYHPMLSYDVMSMCCVVLAFEPLSLLETRGVRCWTTVEAWVEIPKLQRTFLPRSGFSGNPMSWYAQQFWCQKEI